MTVIKECPVKLNLTSFKQSISLRANSENCCIKLQIALLKKTTYIRLKWDFEQIYHKKEGFMTYLFNYTQYQYLQNSQMTSGQTPRQESQ